MAKFIVIPLYDHAPADEVQEILDGLAAMQFSLAPYYAEAELPLNVDDEDIPPDECRAIRERRELTQSINTAIGLKETADGSELALLRSFGVLRGIVNEYRDGGDQMVEDCDCGEHTGS